MPRRAAGHQLNPIFERDRSRQPNTSRGTTEEPIVAVGGGGGSTKRSRWSTTRAVTSPERTPARARSPGNWRPATKSCRRPQNTPGGAA
jgi:hypothetical protein